MNGSPKTPSPDETVPITNLNQFVAALTGWHTKGVSDLKNLQQLPEGTEVSEDDGEPIVLEGDAHKAFLIGLRMGLDLLGTLPFVAEFEADESDATPNSDAPTH